MNHSVVGILLALLAVHSTVAVYIELGSGEPSCKTEEEMDTRIFRNHWDPTAFWKCVTINEPAVLMRCPEEQAYMDNVKDCLPWDQWEWMSSDPSMSEADK